MCFPVNIGNVLRTAFSVGHRAPLVAAFNKDRGKNFQMKKKKKNTTFHLNSTWSYVDIRTTNPFTLTFFQI